MRLIAFILSSAIALASIPASASAASNTFRATSVSASCPRLSEGHVLCLKSALRLEWRDQEGQEEAILGVVGVPARS